MQHVHVEHQFTKPVDRVFAYLAEHEHLADLFGAKVTRLRDGEDGERNGVGSARRLKIGPLPGFEETVTAFAPGELIGYRITKGSPLKDHRGEMRFAATPSGGTSFTYDIWFDGKLPGVGGLVRTMLDRNIRAAMPKVEANA